MTDDRASFRADLWALFRDMSGSRLVSLVGFLVIVACLWLAAP